MASNRLPAASRKRHDNSTINLEIEARPQAACGSTLSFGKNMTRIIHSLAGIWSLLAVSQLVALYTLLSAKGVAGTIPYSTLLAVGVIAFLASTTIAWLLVVKKNIKLAMTLSAVMCIYFPFGTILGVITIVVLRNPQSKNRFHLQKVNQ